MLLRDHRASTSRKRQCWKRRHAAIKLGEQRWGQPCFSAPTELIGDGEERFGPELLVCAVACLLYWSPVVDAVLLPMVCYLGCFAVVQWWKNFPVTRSMANTPRTSNTSRKNPPIRVKDSPATTEQVVLITWSPGMNCVAQSTQYAISSGGQNVASSETKAASMKALPKRNQRLRSWYLRWLRHRLTAKRLAKSAPQYTFQLVIGRPSLSLAAPVYGIGTKSPLNAAVAAVLSLNCMDDHPPKGLVRMARPRPVGSSTSTRMMKRSRLRRARKIWSSVGQIRGCRGGRAVSAACRAFWLLDVLTPPPVRRCGTGSTCCAC